MMITAARILLTGVLLYFSYIETGIATALCLFLITIRFEVSEHFTETIIKKLYRNPQG